MQRVVIVSVSTLMLAFLAVGFLTFGSGTAVFAKKPAEVVKWSNGYPSGPHFNMNIHGKKDGFACDPGSGGGSVSCSSAMDSTPLLAAPS